MDHAAPIPFDDTAVVKFWPDEPWDENLPHPGFITDFVMTLRGIEAPTKYAAWTALFLISSILKRDAWLAWYPSRFYANLYVFLVGPPATGKSTAINFGEEMVINQMDKYITHPITRVKKKPRTLHTKATPEGLVKFLSPSTVPVQVDAKNIIGVKLGSQGSLVISELATFLGRQQYNIGLVEMLTNLYDCKASDDMTTASRAKEDLQDIYLTLFGATTADGLANSIPESAFGDGFMSRVIIVYTDSTVRSYPKPKKVVGGPTSEDLAKRLAWIAETAQGEYDFSPDAEEYFVEWYHNHKRKLRDHDEISVKGLERHSTHLRKLALLLRAQRYEKGNVIEKDDLLDAKKLLESTQEDYYKATTNVGADRFTKVLNTISTFIERRKAVTRTKLLQNHSPRGIRANEISIALRELFQNERIRIELDGKQKAYPSDRGHERYIWAGK